MLSKTPPLGFLRVTEKETKIFFTKLLGVKVPLYSESSNDLILFFIIYLFIH